MDLWDVKNRETGVVEIAAQGRQMACEMQNYLWNRGLKCDVVASPAGADEWTNPYAVDGRCHNAEPGTFNHECGAPAVWLGIRPGFASGFCSRCRFAGAERTSYRRWIVHPSAVLPEKMIERRRALLGD
jgi:hypothetical protein